MYVGIIRPVPIALHANVFDRASLYRRLMLLASNQPNCDLTPSHSYILTHTEKSSYSDKLRLVDVRTETNTLTDFQSLPKPKGRETEQRAGGRPRLSTQAMLINQT